LVGLTRAIYWKRKYKGKQEQAPWYLLTNFPDCETAVKIYGKRFGIEAMFKDCKTGGYNLEGSQALSDRLVRASVVNCPRYVCRLATGSVHLYSWEIFLYLSAKRNPQNSPKT
jgi:hypothetical protein